MNPGVSSAVNSSLGIGIDRTGPFGLKAAGKSCSRPHKNASRVAKVLEKSLLVSTCKNVNHLEESSRESKKKRLAFHNDLVYGPLSRLCQALINSFFLIFFIPV